MGAADGAGRAAGADRTTGALAAPDVFTDAPREEAVMTLAEVVVALFVLAAAAA